MSADLVSRIERMLEVMNSANEVPQDCATFENINANQGMLNRYA